ncbi:DUF4856 domain-containing protein [Flocculibacter collagenilyticus]|uniref:DUF4856 domain-containing protein n=1 Tax=Flocculibacter collagenilyticus TaxID=2744479 RepID=UPI0018F7A6D7|nr:DUF4856 domain-containing protein [Flocculibacter collagenilyticus]
MKAFKKSLIATTVILLTSGLTACGGSSSSDTPATETPTNTAPTAITLSSATVSENAAGATIGTLSATDANSTDTFTYSINDERFVISGNELKLAESTSLNFEQTNSVDVDVTVTDSANNSLTKTLTITVEDVLDVYAFTSNFTNESSVNYSGQIARHVLISELTNYISSGLKADLDAGELTNKADVVAKLMSLYKVTSEEYDLVLGERALTITASPETKQKTLKDISSSKKDLSGKIAGNDATGQHKDWSTDFEGWGAKGAYTPESLVELYFDMLGDHAQAYLDGAIRQDALGNDINKIYLTANGQDLKQLVQKFLLGAVAFSQGADDYLDDDVAGKGLLSDNTQQVDGKAYTALEHNYDEGFGYFGAARDYLDYSDDEIAAKDGREDWQGHHDTDGDAMIDLNSEYNFGNSTNAAKRDRGTKDNTNATDFTANAMNAFLKGREIITNAGATALTDEQMSELKAQRDIALSNWEMSISATVVHYINDVLADYDAFGSDDFNYENLAKHWSELKGFSLGLQFNPHSPVSDENYTTMQSLIGDMPELNAEAIATYRAKLITARALLQDAYGFDSENVENW